MKILAVDSSALVASVALAEDGALLGEYTINNKNTHSETLLPMIESLLGFFSLSASDVDLFAVSSGPGSFTGVRIGAATVKGLAFAMNRACVGVSTLEALAYNMIAYKGLVCAVMNARRAQVYTALFRSDGDELTRITEDTAMSIAELDELLSSHKEEVALVGDGYSVCIEAMSKTELFTTPERLRHQSAFSVAQVALGKYRKGLVQNDAELGVNYLRPSQAERERAEREGKNNV